MSDNYFPSIYFDENGFASYEPNSSSDQTIAETLVFALPATAADRQTYSRQQLLAFRDSQPAAVVGASRASIEAMPRVVVTDEGTECSICLESFQVCAEAKEMPCEHKFHSHCIDNWLQRRASCPLCRFTMPVDNLEQQITMPLDDLEEQMNSMSGGPLIVEGYIWEVRDMSSFILGTTDHQHYG